MKKYLISLAMAVCTAQTAFAVSAAPSPITVQQADGTLLTILLQGDEYGHLAVATDGSPLYFNPLTANYEYAELTASGHIAGSGIVATDVMRRSAAASAYLKSQDAAAIQSVFQQQRQQRMAQLAPARLVPSTAQPSASPLKRLRTTTKFPVTGQPHSLVILVAFSDQQFSSVGDDVQGFYNNMLNQEGFTYSNGANGSVRDYYMASSGSVFQPTFDVVGPVTLPNTVEYYGTNVGNGDKMERLAEFVSDAVTLADPLVDYAQYDFDGDGYIDNIYFYYAGYGEADSGKDATIWPHSFDWDQFYTYGYTDTPHLVVDGKRMGTYACSNEIVGSGTYYTTQPTPAGIGTFVHEFGHVLGLCDHYDTAYGYSFTPGAYDAMDTGSYNNHGNTPPTFSAFERGELGWLQYTNLTQGTDTLTVLPELQASNMAYCVPVDSTEGREFFVLENRQLTGWDEYLPGHGMLLWHIDIDTLAWTNNTPNNTMSHQRVDIVEADGKRNSGTTAGDAFPGSSNVLKCSLVSWAGDTLLNIDDIEERGGNIYLMQAGLPLKLATPELLVTQQLDSTISVDWQPVAIARQYSLSVYKSADETLTPVSGFANVTLDAATTSAAISGLEPSTDYVITLSARRGSYLSDTCTVNARTADLAFEKHQPQGTTLTAQGNGSASTTDLLATWQPVEGADDYLVTLTANTYADAETQRGYDFTGRDAQLPELWRRTGTYISSNSKFYGAASPSLRIGNQGYLLMAYPDSRISGIQFWVNNSSSTYGTLAVETAVDGQWATQATYTTDGSATTAGTLAYTFEQADSVRLVFTSSNGSTGAVYLDDILLQCHDVVRTPVSGYEALRVGNTTTYTFPAMPMSATYGFTVRGCQADLLTYPSAEQVVRLAATDGISEVIGTNPLSSPAMRVYDLQGRQMPQGAQLHNGLYIVKQGERTVKVIKR